MLLNTFNGRCNMPIGRWEGEGGLVRHAKAKTPPKPDSPYHSNNRKRAMEAERPRTFKTRIDLPLKRREKLIALLNQHLADTFDLYGQAKQAHWNVKGVQFHQLHELFDELADELREFVDLIAERATALGGTALGTVRMSAAGSRLPDYPLVAGDSIKHVEALAVRFAALAATTRSAIESAEQLGDADTADLFTEVSRGLDKALWFLEAHLQA
jgi:starvation-inducible DNA-binding protein